MLAEEAIPKGVEVARDYFAAEAEAKLARANAETDLVRQGLDLERTARLAAEAEAEKWRSEARRALAAEAERDDLLGALRDVSQAIHSDGTLCWCVYERMIHPQDDPQDALPLEENGHHRSCNRARAAIAKVTK
jgi:hypothetical protein